eukprot:714620-Pelagomonas_calceolata.AAC.1
MMCKAGFSIAPPHPSEVPKVPQRQETACTSTSGTLSLSHLSSSASIVHQKLAAFSPGFPAAPQPGAAGAHCPPHLQSRHAHS